MQNQQPKMEDFESALSFNCYSYDSITSRAVKKAIHEEEVARLHENGYIDNEDFEFSLALSDEESDARGWTVFNRDLLVHVREISGSLEDSSSYTSSEADELDSSRSKTKCKKSSSFGSGSKRWIFRYLLRRSNSEHKERMAKEDSAKQKRNSGEVSNVDGWWKAHEQFYEQKRAENEFGKRRSYLPYKKEVGLFANVSGMGRMGKMFPL